jgi:hypothetical protein
MFKKQGRLTWVGWLTGVLCVSWGLGSVAEAQLSSFPIFGKGQKSPGGGKGQTVSTVATPVTTAVATPVSGPNPPVDRLGWNASQGCQVYPRGTISVGGRCTDTSECAPGNNGCWKNMCTGKNLAAGSYCNENNQCSSDRCESGRCGGLVALGGSCSSSAQCFSGNNGCWQNKCTGKNLATGSWCNENNQCASDSCVNNRCGSTGVALGGSCSNSSQCFAGNNGCWRGMCTGKNLSNGSWCNEGNQCSIGVCTNNLCGPANVPLGGSCQRTEQCFSGNNGCWHGKCTGTHGELGTWCNEGNQCSSDRCHRNQCVMQDRRGTPGQFCNEGNQCNTGRCSQNRCSSS